MDSTGMEHGGQAGGEKLAKFALTPPVGSVQVCAKAGNLLRSIRRSEAEAQRLGCSLLLLLRGALITVIAPPCSLRFFDISALAQSLILAFGQIFSGPWRACAGRDERVLWYSCWGGGGCVAPDDPRQLLRACEHWRTSGVCCSGG